MASLFWNPTITNGRDEVYVAGMPLRAAKGPAQLAMSAVYSLNLWDLQHFMVILKPSSPPPHSQVLVFDFQPQDPEDIFVAFAVLSGRSVPEGEVSLEVKIPLSLEAGAVLARKLRTLPRSKCWFVGYSKADAVDIASTFNKNWDTNLRVGLHDCRDYTNGLVQQLTGEKNVLTRLRSTGNLW